ncbi:MAG: DUF1707 domain-containing protein [Micropruina sp.]|nr:DUF1707 domain-containing protein [Micropruina sp.]
MSLQPHAATGPGRWARPEIRIGDAERDQTCQALSEHFSAGRLTGQEFEQRAEQAVSARTGADLQRLLADLPAPPIPVAPVTPVAMTGPGGQQAPVARPAAPVFDVLFALVAVFALMCLMVLFALGGSMYVSFGFFACLGAGTVAAAVTHFVHRLAQNRRI